MKDKSRSRNITRSYPARLKADRESIQDIDLVDWTEKQLPEKAKSIEEIEDLPYLELD
jgi:hypothetical protein